MFKPWLHNDFIYHLTDEGKKAAKLSNDAKVFIKEFLRQKKELYEKLKAEDKINEDSLFGKRNGFGERMLLAIDKDPGFWTEEIMIDNMLTIFPAASDSSATTVSYSLVLLGIHQDVQEKTVQELDMIFGDSDRQPDFEDVHNMVYLEQVIKEAMRLFPATPIISRQLTQDIELGEYTIPKGTCCMIPIAFIHRDPKFWKNPEKFDPDRFDTELKQEPYTYLPFSAGSRSCVGYRYGMMFVKCLLSTILRRYHVTTPLKMSDLRLVQELTLSSEGVKIQLENRQSRSGGLV